MPAGLGGGGWVALTFEAVNGTYLPPDTAGTVWIPVNSETLAYTETHYFSPQIRQQTIESDAKSGYYSIAGDIVVDVDMNTLPYLLYCSRHTITKTGSVAPWTYKFVPSQAGSSSTAGSGAVARTASITVVRNGIGFGYAGCVVNTMNFTLNAGVLQATLGIIGLSEATPGSGVPGTPTWVAPSLFGADAHSVYVDAAGTSPTFASADLTHEGFTADINYNAAPQNRVNAARSASYVSYGMTDATYSSTLDFLDKTEFTNFKNLTFRAVKLESLKGGTPFSAATEAFQLIMYKTTYETYPVNLSGMGDLIMAQVTGKAIGIAGGDPFAITLKSGVNIT